MNRGMRIHFIARRCGFSLLEVTIGSMLTALIAVMVSGVAFDISRHVADNIAETQIAAEARIAIETIRRDFGGCCPDVITGDRSQWRLVGFMIPNTRELRLCFDADRDASADWMTPDRVVIYSLDGDRLIRSDVDDGREFTVARHVDDIEFTSGAGQISIIIDFALGDFSESYTFATSEVR